MSNADDVAVFLKDNPGFFQLHPELIEHMTLPNPHGDGAVSLAERQMQLIRDKSRALEEKLTEMVRFGAENDQLSEKVHRFALQMMRSRDLAEALDSIYATLRDTFQVPHAAIRLWADGGQQDIPECQTVGEEIKSFVNAMHQPYCGQHAVYETASWFGDAAPHLKSFAMVPLRADWTFGTMVLASEDRERFYPEMGTLYLGRIADLAGSALARQLGASDTN